MTITPGTEAPDFRLPATTGHVSLQQLRGRPFLLSFYSMAFTPT